MDNLNDSGRRVLFTVGEKICLQKLIIKHRLLAKNITTACRRSAWADLTKEFNTLKTNNYRTEAQLKKCWDNIKCRRKQALEKKPRLDLSGDEPVGASQEDSIDDPLMPVKQEKMWASAPAESDTDIASKEFELAEVAYDTTSIGQGSLPTVAEDYCLVKSTKSDGRIQEREEELHKLKVAEKVWQLKTLREKYATAQLERERAQFEREKALFERDLAQLQKEKAQLEFEKIKCVDDVNIIYHK